MDITFYYASNPEAMLHLKEHCTIWLPEQQPTKPPELWTSGQFIATCDVSYLFRLRDKIQDGTIQPDKVIWIGIKNQVATGYVFDKTGKIVNFFRLV